ncbi:cytochrome P450 [Streptomyces spectabilis]|uniref:cytochrome P450 family protein n=1 Tax=Streptomyces spectabilis TaxID=68270 RepID=UPI0033D429FB
MDLSLSTPLDSLDPYATDVADEGRRIREIGRLVPVRLVGDVRAWTTAHHAVAQEVFTHPGFVKNPSHWAAFQNGEVPAEWPILRLITIDSMLNRDGADHTRLRSLVSRAFTPRRVEALQPRIREITNELVAHLSAWPAGEVLDLRAEYAFPFPMQVICELFGLARGHRAQLADDYAALHDSRTSPSRLVEANHGVEATICELIESKRQHPADDLTSALISIQDADQGRLTDRELSETLVLFLFAGHETTQNLITNAVRELIEHPDQLHLACQGSDATWQDVVEETLRRTSPVNTVMFRYASQDITVPGTGVTVLRGEPVVLCVAGTGRDPEKFGHDAEAFDLTRSAATQHLAFSRGVHYCLGAPLGRMMAATALEALFTRFDITCPDLGALQPLPSYASQSVQTLPVTLSALARV